MVATTQGKEKALEALAQRRAQYADRKMVDNSLLVAGSPMFYGCLGCNAMITVPESWISRPTLCSECAALKELGWLE